MGTHRARPRSMHSRHAGCSTSFSSRAPEYTRARRRQIAQSPVSAIGCGIVARVTDQERTQRTAEQRTRCAVGLPSLRPSRKVRVETPRELTKSFESSPCLICMQCTHHCGCHRPRCASGALLMCSFSLYKCIRVHRHLWHSLFLSSASVSLALDPVDYLTELSILGNFRPLPVSFSRAYLLHPTRTPRPLTPSIFTISLPPEPCRAPATHLTWAGRSLPTAYPAP
jgi:hypothetical protein